MEGKLINSQFGYLKKIKRFYYSKFTCYVPQTLEELEKNLYEYPLEVEELQTSNANLRKEVQDTRDAGAATRETLLARREEELAEMRETNEAVKVWAL